MTRNDPYTDKRAVSTVLFGGKHANPLTPRTPSKKKQTTKKNEPPFFLGAFTHDVVVGCPEMRPG